MLQERLRRSKAPDRQQRRVGDAGSNPRRMQRSLSTASCHFLVATASNNNPILIVSPGQTALDAGPFNPGPRSRFTVDVFSDDQGKFK